MKRVCLLVVFMVVVPLLSISVSAVETPPHNLYGYLTDNETGEPIEGAEISFVGNEEVTTFSGEGGWYDINVEEDVDIYVGGLDTGISVDFSPGASEELNITNGTAVFYDLTISVTGEGTTYPEPGTHTYQGGEEVTITADPGSGWFFDGWSGTGETGDEITITMDEDKEITAHFTDDEDDDDNGNGNGNGRDPSPAPPPAPAPEDPETKEVDAERMNGYYLAEIGEVAEDQLIKINIHDGLVDRIAFTSSVSETDVSLQYRNLGLDLPGDLEDPDGYTYSYFSTSLRGVSSDEFYNASIVFNVDEFWVGRISEEVDDIVLLRHSDRWDTMPTSFIEIEDGHYRFRSNVPGFSVFSVVSDVAVEDFADVRVSNFRVNPQEGEKPLDVDIDILLENIGTRAGSKEVEIYLNGELLDTRSVSVGGGQMATEEIGITVDEAGTHVLEIDGIERQVVVHDDVLSISPFILIIAVIIISAIIGLSFFVFRLKSGSESTYESGDWGTRKILHSISNLNENIQNYMGEDVVLRNVRVEPIKEDGNGWWHTIKDNTGSIYGFSQDKVSDSGNIEGFVERKKGKAYVMF